MSTEHKPKLTEVQIDRAAGVLLATACGDALGAGYEFGDPLPETAAVDMVGGGGFGWAPGEWTDDTSMAVAIAEIAATGTDLRTPEALDAIGTRWVGWSREAADVGVQTSAVLRSAGATATGTSLTGVAIAHHHRTSDYPGHQSGQLQRGRAGKFPTCRHVHCCGEADRISDLVQSVGQYGDHQ